MGKLRLFVFMFFLIGVFGVLFYFSNVEESYIEAKMKADFSSFSSVSVKSPSSSSGVRKEVVFNFAGSSFTQSGLKSSVNSNGEIKGYIKSFGYDCVYLVTDKGNRITFKMDVDSGEIVSVKKGKSCDREVFLEESLITQIKSEGFSASRVKDYLEKVDLPWAMYGKALKVFTVG
ncbi:MAG: hypothetical protein ACOCXG_00925 [Nanoarchaeota archaeon]